MGLAGLTKEPGKIVTGEGGDGQNCAEFDDGVHVILLLRAILLMAFDDEANSRLTPFLCVSWFQIEFIESSGNGRMALGLAGPF